MINDYDPEVTSNDLFDEDYEIKRRKEFSNREVGINHPDNSSFLRVTDAGEIEIFACPGVGIVINSNTRSVSIFADNIKFYSRDDDGLRWNGMSFNPASDMYNEPALIKTNSFSNNPAYHNATRFLDNLEDLEDPALNIPVTIDGKYGFAAPKNPIEDQGSSAGEIIIPKNVQDLIDSYAKTNSDIKVKILIKYIKNGYSFSEAKNKVDSEDESISDNLENFPWIRNDT
jgi:hypothetical protein